LAACYGGEPLSIQGAQALDIFRWPGAIAGMLAAASLS
jgi:hypothetical protein